MTRFLSLIACIIYFGVAWPAAAGKAPAPAYKNDYEECLALAIEAMDEYEADAVGDVGDARLRYQRDLYIRYCLAKKGYELPE